MPTIGTVIQKSSVAPSARFSRKSGRKAVANSSRMPILSESAHQRKEPDVEEYRAPVQFAQDVLEAWRLNAVHQQFQDEYQRDRPGHGDESQFYTKRLAERHAKHRQQEPSDHDNREQLVRDMSLDAKTRHIHRLPAPRAKAVDIHGSQRDRERHDQYRERRRTPLLPDKVHELGTRDAMHHLRRQIAQQQRGTHEICTEADHQHDRRHRQFQRAGQRQRHRRHHQYDDNVVDEHRDHAR